MKCPNCGEKNRVKDSRTAFSMKSGRAEGLVLRIEEAAGCAWVLRRRVCEHCGHTFHTGEIPLDLLDALLPHLPPEPLVGPVAEAQLDDLRGEVRCWRWGRKANGGGFDGAVVARLQTVVTNRAGEREVLLVREDNGFSVRVEVYRLLAVEPAPDRDEPAPDDDNDGSVLLPPAEDDDDE